MKQIPRSFVGRVIAVLMLSAVPMQSLAQLPITEITSQLRETMGYCCLPELYGSKCVLGNFPDEQSCLDGVYNPETQEMVYGEAYDKASPDFCNLFCRDRTNFVYCVNRDDLKPDGKDSQGQTAYCQAKGLDPRVNDALIAKEWGFLDARSCENACIPNTCENCANMVGLAQDIFRQTLNSDLAQQFCQLNDKCSWGTDPQSRQSACMPKPDQCGQQVVACCEAATDQLLLGASRAQDQNAVQSLVQSLRDGNPPVTNVIAEPRNSQRFQACSPVPLPTGIAGSSAAASLPQAITSSAAASLPQIITSSAAASLPQIIASSAPRMPSSLFFGIGASSNPPPQFGGNLLGQVTGNAQQGPASRFVRTLPLGASEEEIRNLALQCGPFYKGCCNRLTNEIYVTELGGRAAPPLLQQLQGGNLGAQLPTGTPTNIRYVQTQFRDGQPIPNSFIDCYNAANDRTITGDADVTVFAPGAWDTEDQQQLIGHALNCRATEDTERRIVDQLPERTPGRRHAYCDRRVQMAINAAGVMAAAVSAPNAASQVAAFMAVRTNVVNQCQILTPGDAERLPFVTAVFNVPPETEAATKARCDVPCKDAADQVMVLVINGAQSACVVQPVAEARKTRYPTFTFDERGQSPLCEAALAAFKNNQNLTSTPSWLQRVMGIF